MILIRQATIEKFIKIYYTIPSMVYKKCEVHKDVEYY